MKLEMSVELAKLQGGSTLLKLSTNIYIYIITIILTLTNELNKMFENKT